MVLSGFLGIGCHSGVFVRGTGLFYCKNQNVNSKNTLQNSKMAGEGAETIGN